jgi:hypothetical protein
MNRSIALALLALLTQVTACLPEPTSEPEPGQFTPNPSSPEQPTGEPSTQTSPFSLTAPSEDPHRPPELPPGNGTYLGILTTDSVMGGSVDFRYDAYVITARVSGSMTLQSDVLESSPNNSYRYGYGYPLTMAAIADGITFTQYGGNYAQDALNTGTAIISYPVQAGQQYILVYKTFSAFTPLTYRLTLPASLVVEGRIYAPPEPVPVPPNSSGPITLENPRPDVLHRIVPWLNERVSGS